MGSVVYLSGGIDRVFKQKTTLHFDNHFSIIWLRRPFAAIVSRKNAFKSFRDFTFILLIVYYKKYTKHILAPFLTVQFYTQIDVGPDIK